jgi:excinuclease ABC subunit A
LFVIEHELDVVRHADWVVDVGPGAGGQGGEILYSGPLAGLAHVRASETARHLFVGAHGRRDRDAAAATSSAPAPHTPRTPRAWLCLTDIERNNLHGLEVALPLGVLCAVTGVSGSGKSSLVSQALVDLLAAKLGHAPTSDDVETPEDALERAPDTPSGGRIASGAEHVVRLVRVDQKPIGRTPRSNLATYTGLFDHVRRAFAATPAARARRYDAGHFSFNLPKGRCATCSGEGSVMVELLFLPSVYAPCPTCHGARYDAKTLAVKLRGRSIADVLDSTVDAAWTFFADAPAVRRALDVLRRVGLGYLRLGQPATELSGGEAQRIKLATELQRGQRAGTIYVLDEPTTGLHPSDVERLLGQLEDLVDGGSTVLVAEHDMGLVARCDWVIDVGPGAGEDGGRIVASGPPDVVARSAESRTAPYLARALSSAGGAVRPGAGAPRAGRRRAATPPASRARAAAPVVGQRRAARPLVGRRRAR